MIYDEAADSIDSNAAREIMLIDTLFRRVVDMLLTPDEHDHGDACAALAGEPALVNETDEYHTDLFYKLTRRQK
jgi:hypothetical protein